MKRTRAERRHNDFTKAKRKWRLDLDTALEISQQPFDKENNNPYLGRFWLMYNNLHQYSKNKIFCSCWMCSKKTNPKNIHGVSNNWSISDRRKLEDMNSQEQEPIDEEN